MIKSSFKNVIKEFDTRQTGALKESIGLRLQKAFLDRISAGDGSWAPLSDWTVEEKGHSNPWYHTGRLESAIEYEIDEDGVRVGVIKHNSYPESGESVASVAAAMEYGTSRIPARPLFGPVFDEQIKDIVEDAAKDIKSRIDKVGL